MYDVKFTNKIIYLCNWNPFPVMRVAFQCNRVFRTSHINRFSFMQWSLETCLSLVFTSQNIVLSRLGNLYLEMLLQYMYPQKYKWFLVGQLLSCKASSKSHFSVDYIGLFSAFTCLDGESYVFRSASYHFTQLGTVKGAIHYPIVCVWSESLQQHSPSKSLQSQQCSR